MQAIINFDHAWGLSPVSDLLVEFWPHRGTTGLLVHWDTRTASLVKGCPDVGMAMPVARTPQGVALGVRVIACQQRHGVAAFFTPDGTAICHDCESPFLWVVTWHRKEGEEDGQNRASD
jgi:hypothetical protein